MSTYSQKPLLVDRAYLRGLLADRNQFPHRREEIDAHLREVFNRRVAVLALDMCGFTKLTARYGIIHFLAMIHQMEQGAFPAVVGNGGQVIKVDADNLFAIFARPEQAVEAALDIFRAFKAMNAVVPEERDIFGSIGIGFGDTMVIGEVDLFGHEMNLACKLGEDIAGKSEMLLTPAAYAALPVGMYVCLDDAALIGGVPQPYHRFVSSTRAGAEANSEPKP